MPGRVTVTDGGTALTDVVGSRWSGMSVAELDISTLKPAEKLELIERLWQSLEAGEIEPPAWHAEVLAEREAEWETRAESARPWEEVKARLRRELL